MAGTGCTTEEKVFFVLKFHETKNLSSTAGEFKKKFNKNNLPSRNTIQSAYQNFCDAGSVLPHLIINLVLQLL